MYSWFARKASLGMWMHRTFLVLALVVMMSQLRSKPALAETTEQPPTAQKETLTTPPTTAPSGEQEPPQATTPTSPLPVETPNMGYEKAKGDEKEFDD